GVMLARMDGFLCREGAYLAFQHRVFDLARIILHAVDEETLAFREGQRQRVVIGTDDGIAAVPIFRQRLVEAEMEIAGFDILAKLETGLGVHRVSPWLAGTKSILSRTAQSGQAQLSGISLHFVPGAKPSRAIPFASS